MTKACKACGTDCLKCTSSTKCTLCKPLYFVNADDGSCDLCTTVDAGNTNCNDCTTGMAAADVGKTCHTCKDGYFKNVDNICVGCDDTTNCVVCDTTTLTLCTKCIAGKYRDGDGACQSCIANCDDCATGIDDANKASQCAVCSQRYVLQADKTCDFCLLPNC